MILVDMVQHRFEVLRVDQKKAVVIRDLKNDEENICLQLIELENSRKKERSHLRDRRAELNALLAVDVPEGHRISLVGESALVKAESLDAGAHVFAVRAGRHHACQIALDIRQEYGNAHIAESLRHDT